MLLVEFSASAPKWSKSRFSAFRLIFNRLLLANYLLLSCFLAWTFVLALGVICNGHKKSLDRGIAEVSILRFAILRILISRWLHLVLLLVRTGLVIRS